MIRPQPRSAMDGPNRCPSRNGAVRFTSSDRSHSAAVSSPRCGRRFTPAQFTRMSGSPNGAAASPAARATASRLLRSPLTHATVHPSAVRSAAYTASRPASLATSTTRAPARASAPAIAAPIPELPPVIRATRPSRENSELR
jgi:hypothetical protein